MTSDVLVVLEEGEQIRFQIELSAWISLFPVTPNTIRNSNIRRYKSNIESYMLSKLDTLTKCLESQFCFQRHMNRATGGVQEQNPATGISIDAKLGRRSLVCQTHMAVRQGGDSHSTSVDLFGISRASNRAVNAATLENLSATPSVVLVASGSDT